MLVNIVCSATRPNSVVMLIRKGGNSCGAAVCLSSTKGPWASVTEADIKSCTKRKQGVSGEELFIGELATPRCEEMRTETHC